MTTERANGSVPEWTFGDRLRKARQVSGLTVRDFAEEIGVSTKTITDAEGDRRRPRKILINAYAMRTGVPREWLETGQVSTDDNGPETGINTDATTRHARTGVVVRTLPTRLAIAA